MLAVHAVSADTADAPLHVRAWHELCVRIGHRQYWFIADCKPENMETRAVIDGAQGFWSPVHDRRAAAIPLSQSLNPSCFRASNDFEFSELGVEGVPADTESFGHAGDVPLEMDVRPADGFFLHPLEIKGG